MERKIRAKNNRTLSLDRLAPGEAALLRSRLLRAEDVRRGKCIVDRTVNADLLEVLPLVPDGFADLIIADPPYNLTRDFNGLRFGARTAVEYEDFLRSWLPAVCSKLKPGGSMYVCGDWRCTASIQRVLESELTVLNRITWQREKGRGAGRNWKNSMEDIWFAVRDPKNYKFNLDAVKVKRRVVAPYRAGGKPKDWKAEEGGNFRLTCPSNFWDDLTVPFWSMGENTDHPTQKPEKLYAKLLLASSDAGDVVFDPFLGSGTASVVAKKLGRRFCGVELNEEYCILAEKRLSLAEHDRTIQGYADGVFWERNSAPPRTGS